MQGTSLKCVARWNNIKNKLKKYLKAEARERSKVKKEMIADLSETICDFEENFPLNQKDYVLYLEAVNQLNSILEEKTRGMIFRCRAKWYELGEKSNKYFYNLERIRACNKVLKYLIREDGSHTTTQEEIIHEQYKFYSDLYKSDPNISFCITNNTNLKLSHEQITQLQAEFSAEEIKSAVFSLAKGKSPGPDGLSAEIYQKFWASIGQVYIDFLNEAFQEEQMSGSTMQGILNLIPKQKKDGRLLKNLRPITLLNVDYKIIEKAIAKRIQKVLPSIIQLDQSGFMKNRRAAVTIRKLFDLNRLLQTPEY